MPGYMSFTAFWVYGLSELVVTLYYFHYWQNPDPAEVLFTDVVLLHLGAVCRICGPFLAVFCACMYIPRRHHRLLTRCVLVLWYGADGAGVPDLGRGRRGDV
jgi:hypothetical protein